MKNNFLFHVKWKSEYIILAVLAGILLISVPILRVTVFTSYWYLLLDAAYGCGFGYLIGKLQGEFKRDRYLKDSDVTKNLLKGNTCDNCMRSLVGLPMGFLGKNQPSAIKSGKCQMKSVFRLLEKDKPTCASFAQKAEEMKEYVHSPEDGLRRMKERSNK